MRQNAFGNISIYSFLDEYPDSTDPTKYQFRMRNAFRNIDQLVIHHWASDDYEEDCAPETEIAAMLDVRSMWMQNDGVHNTVGYPYHFTVFPSGRQYYNGSLYTSRSCVTHENDHILCLALPGNFMLQAPSARHLDAVRELIANIFLVMGKELTLVPHSSYGESQCPGATFADWKEQILP